MRIKIATIAPESPAAAAGLACGDEIARVGGVTPRDLLDYARLAAGPGTVADLADGRTVPAAALSGATLDGAVFDDVMTCDNHCEFCFIYQLPKQMRKSLYLKDDDYRLSALYGNFTTLTRFTEADLERIVEERISPMYVSVHCTDAHLRAKMLRNPKGAMSLRWMRAMLDAGIEVHAQVVCCPGINDGDVLDQTLCDLIFDYSELTSVGVVPLGVSRFNTEKGLRAPTRSDAVRVLDSIEFWQSVGRERLGRGFVYASDEVYLMAGNDFPDIEAYDGFPQHDNGIGMARALEFDLRPTPNRAVEAPPWGYRPNRHSHGEPGDTPAAPRRTERVAVLTGTLGAPVISPLIDALGADGVDVVAVENRFFGGNVGVSGLLCGTDLVDAIAALPAGTEPVIADVVFSEGRTLDEYTAADIAKLGGRDVRVVSTDATGLRIAVGA